MTTKQRIRSLTLLLAATFSLGFSQAFASPGELTRAFSGIWDQKFEQSQGFVLQISESESEGKIGVVYWFTYDDDLTPAWYLGVGPVVDNTIDMKLYKSTGIAFMQTGVEGNPEVEEIGTLLMSFRNCNQGTVAYDTPEEELGSGETAIQRLTSLYRMRCSGAFEGDDDEQGEGDEFEVEVELTNTGIIAGAKGTANYEEDDDRQTFKVKIRDLPAGAYPLYVNGIPKENIVVEERSGPNRGELRFSIPVKEGDEELDFDPIGALIEVKNEDDTEVILWTTFE